MLGLALRDTGLSLRDLTALARCADDIGYDAIWAPEVGSRDAIYLAGTYGAATNTVTVGTGVVPVFSRKLVSLALSVAAAAEASNGRFILGLGTGHPFATEAWYEARWSNPREQMRATTQTLRAILSGERIDHTPVAGFHLGSKPPPVPIWFGALTPSSLRLAGEVADGVILNWLPPEGIEKASLLVREAAADAGRSVNVAAYVRTAVVDDPADEHDARVAMHEQTYAYLSLPTYANSVRKVGYGRELDAMANGHEKSVDALVDGLCAWGDQATVAQKLGAFREAGVDQVVVYPVPFGDDPAESVLRTIRGARS
jgi:alkanesulfonate monooxygenase SsuD/methylene tetrahydromethanopterin reductase-like flavin-dependent oxidoreductase (luciferase family)